MADKEATVYIIDVGKSMGEKNNDRSETDLDWAMHYIWDRIATTVSTGRKTLLVGVVALRTDGTNNALNGEDDDNYQNISVLAPLGQFLMPDIRRLKDLIRPSKTEEGDAISALIIAIQMINEQCRKLKYRRQIVLITNGRGQMDPDGLEGIVAKIKEDDMRLQILGIDFDDPEFGFKEENKDPEKLENEKLLKDLVEECDGDFGTVAEAVAELAIPRVKPTRPVQSFKGNLTLGNPEEYESALSIDVERYPKTAVAKPPTASSFVIKSDAPGGEPSGQSSVTMQDGNDDEDGQKNELAAIHRARTYQVNDEKAPGGKKEVTENELEKGYSYGSTAVHISGSDMSALKIETQACLDIMGFIPRDKFDRYMLMSKVSIIVAQKANEKAAMALSSLAHALFEQETYAIARLVPKAGRDPVIVLLAHCIEPEFEGLFDVELPFSEDMRGYRFPPLDKVVTVGGATHYKHRNLPDDDLMKAMSDYVDRMDLSTYEKDEDGNPVEYAALEDTYSPVLHRINQAIRWRAVHPAEDIPPPGEILTKYSGPPTELIEDAQSVISTLLKAADVKKVPPKVKGRKRNRETERPLSGLDVDALLNSNKRSKISPENAIPEFKQYLASTTSSSDLKDAAKQMSKIIQDYIRHSVGDSGYGRAIEALSVLRNEMVDSEEPVVYNDVLRQLKEKVLGGELGGNRKDVWWKIRANRLGLVDKKQWKFSDVSEEEAKEFLIPKL
ncbi:putative Ku family DNA helicase [Patellaria atrata CBS 101060]|uniref:ATP-dependent DNA helicase II subunit 2 n=1 Tax=Patellaria atrata CBS 101060 TaxID=1346257 RepID=A0A9P4S1M7_9PEZI|nr:putative Ku family DNA helicase [Patellaria atrata CBS 101060]